MRISIKLVCAAVLAISALTASGQGLVAIQNYSGDFESDEPLTWSVGIRGGYDSLNYKVDSPFVDDFDSYYVQGGIGATFADADPTTPWNVAVDLGMIHYLDDIPRYDDNFYNARVAFNIVHQLSERLKVSDNFYVAYESQPNIATGATTTLYNGQYLYGFNNFNVSYAWSQRFSTTTSHTIDGISYQDDVVSGLEDRLSNLIAQQFTYALTKRTSLSAEYRFRMTSYRHRSDVDSQSHFVLAGIDHAWSERSSGSFRAGAEFFRSDRTNSTAPYAEMALNYKVARQTSAQWFGALGFDGAELGGFDSRYSLRTGLSLNHQINKRIAVNGGAAYSYSEFDGGGIGDITEHSVSLSAGLSYSILENVALDARYTYSILRSDDSIREFDRNNVSLGVTASF
ncbi:MAG: outer membrane beta-barrel protein [Prosthecobacter sp.]|nr:outer membrane beta-barrel protein [Prosthecobacter sp.]